MRTAGSDAATTGTRRVVPVLMYHTIGHGDARYRKYFVSPARFAEHMAHLATEGFHTHRVSELPRLMRRPAQPTERDVAITFDDAFTDFAEQALPILERHRFTATLFVPTAFVGGAADWLRAEGEGGRRILDWDALRDVAAAGIECGGHSATHPELDRLTRREVLQEAERCRQDLRLRLGVEARAFAYPYGYHSAAVRRAVRDAGFDVACQVADDVCTPSSDLLALPRLTVDADVDVARLARLLDTRPSRPRSAVGAIKRSLWHTARRALRQPARRVRAAAETADGG